MKPVMQKLISKVDGDCFGACIASILELEEWPNFHTDTRSWLEYWNDWLEPLGLEVVYAQHIAPPRGYAIMSIKSVNIAGATHAVVWHGSTGNGKVVHDPSPLKHPDDYEPVGWYILATLNPRHLAEGGGDEKHVLCAHERAIP